MYTYFINVNFEYKYWLTLNTNTDIVAYKYSLYSLSKVYCKADKLKKLDIWMMLAW